MVVWDIVGIRQPHRSLGKAAAATGFLHKVWRKWVFGTSLKQFTTQLTKSIEISDKMNDPHFDGGQFNLLFYKLVIYAR